jgi:hypothetical protein
VEVEKFMKEGFWLNFRNGFEVRVPDHEVWVRRPENARTLGIPEDVVAEFGSFRPEVDRERFLMHLMKNAPIMRVRGHGQQISFEYSSRRSKDAVEAAFLWAKRNAGPFSSIYIANLTTGETTSLLFKDFEELMNTGGYDAVMRQASKMNGLSLSKIDAIDVLNKRMVAMKVRAKDILEKRAMGDQLKAYIRRSLGSLEAAMRMVQGQPMYFIQPISKVIDHLEELIVWYDTEGWEPTDWTTAQEEDDLGMGVSSECRSDQHERCQSVHSCECRCHGYEPEE